MATNNLIGSGNYNYVVAQFGNFHTIQNAINGAAADIAAGSITQATVFIEPGTYVEDLALSANVNLLGSSEGQVIITGTHVPSAVGPTSFTNLQLGSTGDILLSAVAGATDLSFNNCTFAMAPVAPSYIFNLPNWTGSLLIDNCLETSTQNAIINNTAGLLFIKDSACGAGLTTMTMGGSLSILNSRIFCPITATGNVLIDNGSTINDTINYSGLNTLEIFNSRINGGANRSLVLTAATSVFLENVIIQTALPALAIDSVGASTVEVAEITFEDSNLIAGTVTYLGNSSVKATKLIANSLLEIEAGLISVNGSTGTDGQIIIAKTVGNPAYANITSTGGTVAITNGASTINLEVAEGGINWQDQAADTAMTAGVGYINTKPAAILTLTLPAVCPQGGTIEIAGSAANLWAIAQNAGQTIYFANQQTTLGVGGSITSTNAHDSLRMVCIVANTTFQVLSSVGAGFIIV